MSIEIRYKVILAALLLCVLGLAAQTYYLWSLDQKYTAIAHGATTTSTELTPLEEKILDAAADEPTVVPFPSVDPFAIGGTFGADPFAGIQAMRQRMDALFGSVFGSPMALGSSGLLLNSVPGAGNSQFFSFRTPDIRLDETASEYRVYIDVPQSQEVELNTEIEDRTLSISGTVEQELDQNQAGNAMAMFSQSSFARRFPLSHEVDEFAMVTEQTPTGLMVRIPKKTS